MYDTCVVQDTYSREKGREYLGDLFPAQLSCIFLEIIQHFHAFDEFKNGVGGIVLGEHIEYRRYI